MSSTPAPTDKPRVSVIIPVYNDAERLGRCLEALAEQTLPREQFEVIVVDNCSHEPPRELVAQWPFGRFFEESRPGSYAARNRGLEMARGELLAFTDADCLPTEVWLEEGVGALESDPDVALVGGGITVFPADPDNATAVELYDVVFGLPQESHVRDEQLCMTANLFTRRAVFDRIGLFNSELKSAGDHEWCARARDAGLKCVYVGEARVRHPARDSYQALKTKARRYVGGRMDLRDSKSSKMPLLHTLWVFSRIFLPNVPKILYCRRELAAQGYGLRESVQTAAIILGLQYTRAWEFIRKGLGAPSERR